MLSPERPWACNSSWSLSQPWGIILPTGSGRYAPQNSEGGERRPDTCKFTGLVVNGNYKHLWLAYNVESITGSTCSTHESQKEEVRRKFQKQLCNSLNSTKLTNSWVVLGETAWDDNFLWLWTLLWHWEIAKQCSLMSQTGNFGFGSITFILRLWTSYKL